MTSCSLCIRISEDPNVDQNVEIFRLDRFPAMDRKNIFDNYYHEHSNVAEGQNLFQNVFHSLLYHTYTQVFRQYSVYYANALNVSEGSKSSLIRVFHGKNKKFIFSLLMFSSHMSFQIDNRMTFKWTEFTAVLSDNNFVLPFKMCISVTFPVKSFSTF